MSILIILFLLGFVVFVIFIVFLSLSITMPTTYRQRTFLCDYDKITGTVKQFPIKRRKGIIVYGSGNIVYPTGLFSKPYPIERGWKTKEYPNCIRIYTRAYLEHHNIESINEVSALQYELSRAKSKLSVAMSENMKYKSNAKSIVKDEINFVLANVEKLKPVYMQKKSSGSMQR